VNAFRPAEEAYVEQGMNGQKNTHEDRQKMELFNHEMLLVISYLAENSHYASALSTG
jgi:hypothetical protein